MHKCSVCQLEATAKCKCNKKSYCDKDYLNHAKKKGKHEKVIFEEKKEVKKSVSFAGSDTEKPKNPHKEPTAFEIEVNKRQVLKEFLEKEIVKLQRFRLETQSCIHAQQQSLIKTIIEDSKSLTTKILDQCKDKEEILEKTIEELEQVGKLPIGHTILEKVKKLPSNESILKLEGSLLPVTISPEKILDFKITWTTNPIVDDLKSYFDSNSSSIPPKLAKLYQKIFSEKHYSVRKINLMRSKLDLPTLQHFKKITNFFTQIRELRLSSNKIPNEHCEQLSDCLLSFKLVEKLDLSDNDLRGHGIEVITPVLDQYPNLLVLSLAKNSLGATGARHLQLMLESHKNLQELDLDGNNFGAEGARYLSIVLYKLPQLKVLKLRNNNFDESSFRFFKGFLGRMQNIEVLKLENNKFGNEDKRTIQVIIRKECKLDI